MVTYRHRIFGKLKVKIAKLNFTENTADVLEDTGHVEILYQGVPMRLIDEA